MRSFLQSSWFTLTLSLLSIGISTYTIVQSYQNTKRMKEMAAARQAQINAYINRH